MGFTKRVCRSVHPVRREPTARSEGWKGRGLAAIAKAEAALRKKMAALPAMVLCHHAKSVLAGAKAMTVVSLTRVLKDRRLGQSHQDGGFLRGPGLVEE